MKHEFAEIRIPIESDNPAVRREESLCIKCGQCVSGKLPSAVFMI